MESGQKFVPPGWKFVPPGLKIAHIVDIGQKFVQPGWKLAQFGLRLVDIGQKFVLTGRKFVLPGWKLAQFDWKPGEPVWGPRHQKQLIEKINHSLSNFFISLPERRAAWKSFIVV